MGEADEAVYATEKFDRKLIEHLIDTIYVYGK